MVLREHAVVRAARCTHRMDEHITIAMPDERARMKIGRRTTRMPQQCHMRAKRLRYDGGPRRTPLREECVAGGDEALRYSGRAGPDDLAIAPITEMVEGERERRERCALHEREQYRQTCGIDLVEKGQRHMQGLGPQDTSAAFRVRRYRPLVKLGAHTRPGPQGKEESHEDTRGWVRLMILIVDGLPAECQ